MSRLLPCWFALTSLLLTGCNDLADFRGGYAGDIIPGSFVRSCFGDKITATLHFEPNGAVLSSAEAPKSATNWLTTSDGTFDKTLLSPISALANDPLSEFDFPGENRLRNFMFLARPSEGPLAGRDAVVVVSLLQSGRIDLRIMARTSDGEAACAGADADAGADAVSAPREYFGVFRLRLP